MAMASALVQPFAICQFKTVVHAPATSFCIFFSSLSDSASRSQSSFGASRVLDVPVLIARRGKALHFPAG